MEQKKDIIHSETFEKHYEKLILKKELFQTLLNIKVIANNKKFKEKVQISAVNVKEEETLEFPFAAFIGKQRKPYLCNVHVVKKEATSYIFMESIDEDTIFGKDFSKIEPLLFETLYQLSYNLLIPSKIIQATNENKITPSTTKFYIHFDDHIYHIETDLNLEISEIIKLEAEEID